MAPPVYVNGQVLNASDINNFFVPLVGYKTAALGRTGTSRTVDSDLVVALAANCAYEIRCQLMYYSTTAGCGLTWGFVAPTGADGSWGVAYNQLGVGASNDGHYFTDTVSCGTPASTNQSCVVLGVIYTAATSGNLSVSWATSAGTGTTNMNKGSYLVARRIT